MTWNYRVFKGIDVTGDTIYSLRETYYDDIAGKVNGWTGPVVLEGYESVKELVSSLGLMLHDAQPYVLKRKAGEILEETEAVDAQTGGGPG